MLVTGLLGSTGAFAAKPGFNLATQRLEGAYKFALQDRRFDPAGCYAPPAELAGILTSATGRTVGVARGPNGLGHLNQVYVLKSGTNCNRLRMALRAVGGTYVLDSQIGSVRILGRKGAATPGLARTLRNVTLATKSYTLNKPDTAPRLEVLCSGGRYPIGGGMSQSPTVGADGDGIYPHSYERLGAQLGFHISVVVFDPSPTQTTSRQVTVQTVCGRGVIPATPTPHKTVWVRAGQTKTVTARCPKGQFLVSGGFQRTNFRSDGGDYITESRMASKKSWTVTGSAYGTGQGELTAIAYCARMSKPRKGIRSKTTGCCSRPLLPSRPVGRTVRAAPSPRSGRSHRGPRPPVPDPNGEITVRVDDVELLSKSLRPLPRGKTQVSGEAAVTWGGLTDAETRYRQRYADLAVHPEVREVFRTRARVVSWLRRFLDERAFSRSRPRFSSRSTAAPPRVRSSPITTRWTCRST